jgi:hypothetical protein
MMERRPNASHKDFLPLWVLLQSVPLEVKRVQLIYIL